MAPASQTVDPEEIERFSSIAEEWWDENGKFRPLHRLGPVRLQYIRDRACAHFARDPEQMKVFSGLRLIDIGCGGGLMCEPMARLGAEVTGIDASKKNIGVASLHAEKMGLAIDYRCASPEKLVASCELQVARDPATRNMQHATPSYNIVLALEIVEHVADVPAFLKACAALVKPGGLIFMSTLNRTAKSYALAIVGAEYVLRWLPRGTHSWKKFLKPSELCAGLRHERMNIEDMSGLAFNPLKNEWHLSKTDLGVNYLLTASKPAES
jgi:2-polyprenyl-6-hydroxyphenyl methylase/3-demethylubiquinone-9 3-methyltransferase